MKTDSPKKAPTLLMDRLPADNDDALGMLAAAGTRLATEPILRPVREPSAAEHARVDRGLQDVLALAEALPSRPGRVLRFPRLTRRQQRDAA